MRSCQSSPQVEYDSLHNPCRSVNDHAARRESREDCLSLLIGYLPGILICTVGIRTVGVGTLTCTVGTRTVGVGTLIATVGARTVGVGVRSEGVGVRTVGGTGLIATAG